MNLTKQTFEQTALYLIERSKSLDFSEVSDRWTIKFNAADGEWYVRWSNGQIDHQHHERRAYVRDDAFYYI